MTGIEKLNKVIGIIIAISCGSKNREDALEYIADTTQESGLWVLARDYDLLDADRSCEEFAIAFMTEYNKTFGRRY